MRALAGTLATIKGSDDRRIEPDSGRIVAAAGHRPGRRRAGIARHRQQPAACPIRRDVKTGKIRIRSLVAETRDIRLDEPRIPPHHIVVLEFQFFARGEWCVDNEHVGPFDQLLKHLMGTRGFQIKRHTPLVAIGKMPGVGILRYRLRGQVVRVPPQLAVRRLHLDDVGAEVRQNHRGARACDEAGQIYHLQSRENIVICHGCSFLIVVCVPLLHRPRNFGARFSRKVEVPSFLSSVAAQMPKWEASSARPSLWLVSSPLFTASSENFTAIGALAAICFRMVSARSIRLAGGTTSLTRPMRQASCAEIVSPVRINCSARPFPTRRGKRCVPPPPGNKPSFTSGWPNLACSVAILIVQAMAVSQPPPRAKPFTAAITGLTRFSMRSSTPCPNRLDSSAP